MAEKDQLTRLHEAGVCDASQLTENEKQAVSQLSDTEVETLIGIHQKLGTADEGREAARPNFPI